MTHSTSSWLDHLSMDVRAALNNLIAYQPEPEFIRLLAELLPIVPGSSLIDLYYDIWHCVPSCQALRIAIKSVHSPEDLLAYLTLTGRALSDGPACQDFDNHFSEDANLDEDIYWLKRRVRR